MSKIRKALEKAKQTRKADVVNMFREGETVPVAGPPTPKETEPVGETPAVAAQTRKILCDVRTLRKNKIITRCNGEIIADHLKLLRTQVLNSMKDCGANSLLITSANAREGKTFTAINLAMSISQEVDHTVLLVDADLRSPSIHEYFGLDVEAGLADYLLRRAEVQDLLINPGVEKMVILPAGRGLPNSSELLGSSQMQSLAQEMKARYPDRFIIFDSPALLDGADALVIANFVDGVLLVVEEEKTTQKELREALDLLSGKKIIGIILNKTRE